MATGGMFQARQVVPPLGTYCFTSGDNNGVKAPKKRNFWAECVWTVKGNMVT